MKSRVFIVNNIKLPINASSSEAFSIAKRRISKKLQSSGKLSFSVFKRSIDARKKQDIRFIYSVAVEGDFKEIQESDLLGTDIVSSVPLELPDIPIGEYESSAPPLIVGAGPAGLFAALLLAENGYDPIVLERGGSVEERKKCVERFNTFGILDIDTNIQFGAGGAGTFSDGKLVTRINDPLSHYVLKRFVDFGAPEEILYLARPHIGTDVLSAVIDNMIAEIERLGGEVRYHTKYIKSERVNGESVAITNNGSIPYGSLILAIGHSARDTYQYLINSGYAVEAKPFSVGMRIEHLAEDIDRAMYGNFAGHPNLGHAEYNLSHNTSVRGVYTFCMCPGGEVVAAASEEGGVVVNGMSAHSRSGRNSNSAVVCSIFREDYGATPEKAIAFQRSIEKAAFTAGGGEYTAPMITVGDFISDKCKTEPYAVLPTYAASGRVKLARPTEYLPQFVCDSIKNALLSFDKKISGFASDKALLTGAETRTSAPVRITRDNETRLALGKDNVYPCGEGAGYAGGITSAAIDGIKTAYAVMKKYRPKK